MRLFLLSISLITLTCFADDAYQPTSKTDVWLGNLAPGVQVKVDEVSLGVAVTLDKDKDQKTSNIRISEERGT